MVCLPTNAVPSKGNEQKLFYISIVNVLVEIINSTGIKCCCFINNLLST